MEMGGRGNGQERQVEKPSDESEAVKELDQGGRRAKGERRAFLERSADDIMAGAEKKRISPPNIVWRGGGVWRVYWGLVSLVAVVKCRVSINREIRGEERRTGAGQCRWTMLFHWWGVVGNVSSQQAGVVTSECQTNKLLTQIHQLHGAILKHTQCSRQGDSTKTPSHSSLIQVE